MKKLDKKDNVVPSFRESLVTCYNLLINPAGDVEAVEFKETHGWSKITEKNGSNVSTPD